MSAPVSASPNPEIEFKGVGPRILASIIDSVLYLAFAWFVASKTGGTTATGFELTGLPAALSSLAFLAYFVLLEGYLGGTIGKLLLGMRVVSRRGTAPGPGAALIRNLLRLIDFLPAFYLLGVVLIATSREKQRFGDRIACTFVVSQKGAAAMRSAGAAAIRGASGVPVLIGLMAILLGAAYLILAQPGPMSQMGGALGNLPMVGSLVTKQAAPTLSTQSQKPTVATSTTTPAPAAPAGNGTFGQADLRGTWTGKVTLESYTVDGLTSDLQKQFDAVFKQMQSKPNSLRLVVEPRSGDAGTVTAEIDESPMGSTSYRYQNGRFTCEFAESGGKATFDGSTSRRGGAPTMEGTIKMVGQEAGGTITVLASWTATKQ